MVRMVVIGTVLSLGGVATTMVPADKSTAAMWGLISIIAIAVSWPSRKTADGHTSGDGWGGGADRIEPER